MVFPQQRGNYVIFRGAVVFFFSKAYHRSTVAAENCLTLLFAHISWTRRTLSALLEIVHFAVHGVFLQTAYAFYFIFNTVYKNEWITKIYEHTQAKFPVYSFEGHTHDNSVSRKMCKDIHVLFHF